MATCIIANGRLLVGDVELEIFHEGAGRPLLLLHGGEGLDHQAPFLRMLTQEFEVFAPSHPGFGHSELPNRFDSVDDLAYLYLDLIEQLELRELVLAGFSLGGWIAAEVAVRCSHGLGSLILVGPVGIKIGDREARDIPDIFALRPDQVNKLIFHDPARGADYNTLSNDELRLIVRNRESLALYTWEPYMHNPKLRYRLGRIRVPTLIIRGGSDGIVSQVYAESYAALIPGARLEVIPAAGHLPQIEQPEEVLKRLVEFAGTVDD
jgi:pimeloyl-ACP methyl ester carboxylesterase